MNTKLEQWQDAINELQAMSNEDNESELEARIAEAGARQSEYDNWRTALAAECLRRGIAFPSSYALQREWNTHQRRVAELTRASKAAEKKKAARIRQLEERARRTILELQAINGSNGSGAYQSPISIGNSLVAPSADAEPDDAFFASIDAEIAAIQAGDTGGCRTPMEPDHALQEQRALRILQEEEKALKQNNLGEL